MNAIIRFLKAARSLKNSGITKDQVLEFAKKEFGEVSDFMRKQIDNIFKSPATKNFPKKAEKKTGEVVPFKEGIETLEDSSPLMNKLNKTVEEMRLSDDDPMGDLEQILNPKRTGGSLDPAIGITRTLVRRILMEKEVPIGKEDPIIVFDKTFGTDIAIDVKNLAEELLEMERMGKTPKNLDTILKQEGLLDIKIPENPARGMTDDELQKFLKETDEKQILDDFDPTFRKPNAEGGLTRTSYALGKGPVLPSDEDPINPFQPKPTGPVLPDKSMTAEFSLQDYMDEFERVFPDMIDKRGTQEYMDMLEDYFRGLASKDRTGGRVQAASGGLAGIINL